MKNHEETKQAVFDRIHACQTKQNQKKRLMTKVGIPLCCFGIIATAIFGVMQLPTETPAVSNENNAMESQAVTLPPSEAVSTPSANQESAPPSDITDPPYSDDVEIHPGVEDNAYITWNGKKVSNSLYELLKNDDSTEVLFIYANYQGYDPQFVYEGKTLEMYFREAEAERDYAERMGQLLKEGDELKYGEKLYQEGTPDGTKWAKELYEERIAFYGEEFLSTYIVDGEFLREQLEYDMEQTIEHKAERALENAYNAYLQFVFEDVWHQLDSQGIQALVLGGELLVQTTVEQFRTLELTNLDNWAFGIGTGGEDFVIVPCKDDLQNPSCD